MRCLNCDFENAAGNKLCTRCDAPLTATSAKCGSDKPAEASLCADRAASPKIASPDGDPQVSPRSAQRSDPVDGELANQAPRHQEETPRERPKAAVAARRRRERRKQYVKFYIESLAALATVAIAGFTAFYVHYSSKQWETMRQQGETARRQLDNSEAAQRADLIIENFKVMDFPTAPNGMPYATFTVRNVGNTVANEIDITTSARVQSSVNPKELGKALEANIKIAPSPSGWSLAPGRSRSNFNVQFELGPETSQLLAMKRSVFAFVVEVTVSYRDIFKRAHRTSDCLIYDPLYRDFNPCVQGHHRD